jgi:peptidoglycan hydrolase-like protein with peptidoglycan-binding domain
MSISSNFPMVQNGDSGESVEYLQNLLNSYDQASLEADGEFGESTEVAVKAFQEKNDINSDGIVGAETWEVLQALAGSEDESSEDEDESSEDEDESFEDESESSEEN